MKILFALVALVAVLACIDAATIYAKKQPVDCDSKGACKLMIGKSTFSLPALVAFKTAHNHFLSVTPPNGGEIWLSGHPKAWEEWEMVKVGNKVAFKSHHNTFLSQHFTPTDGYTLTSERLDHELFTVEEKRDGRVAIKGHNGWYVSAHDQQSGLSLKQESEASDWEMWTVEYTREGHVALRSVHGTYLGASNPQTYGVVSQQPELNTWETFVIDHVDKERITVETSHDTFIAAHADEWHPDKVVTVDRASMWELWKPYVNASMGSMCLQAHDGRFLTAYEEVGAGWGMAPHCMEHELLQVILVDDKVLAAAQKAAEARRRAGA